MRSLKLLFIVALLPLMGIAQGRGFFIRVECGASIPGRALKSDAREQVSGFALTGTTFALTTGYGFKNFGISMDMRTMNNPFDHERYFENERNAHTRGGQWVTISFMPGIYGGFEGKYLSVYLIANAGLAVNIAPEYSYSWILFQRTDLREYTGDQQTAFAYKGGLILKFSLNKQVGLIVHPAYHTSESIHEYTLRDGSTNTEIEYNGPMNYGRFLLSAGLIFNFG